MQLLLDGPLGVGIPLEHCTAVATFLQSARRNLYLLLIFESRFKE
jgi:hypothetical protein